MKTNWRTTSELIAAISIVLSLIFVGLEIQQSSSVARAEAILSFTSSMAEHSRAVAENEQLARIVYDMNTGALTNLADLSNSERAQLYSMFYANMSLYYGLHSSVQENVLPEEYLSLIDDPYFTAPLFRNIWPGIRGIFGDDFVAFVEARMYRE